MSILRVVGPRHIVSTSGWLIAPPLLGVTAQHSFVGWCALLTSDRLGGRFVITWAKASFMLSERAALSAFSQIGPLARTLPRGTQGHSSSLSPPGRKQKPTCGRKHNSLNNLNSSSEPTVQQQVAQLQQQQLPQVASFMQLRRAAGLECFLERGVT